MHVLMQYGLRELMAMLIYVPLCIVPQVLYIISNLTIDKRLGKVMTLVFLFSGVCRLKASSLRTAATR